MVVVSRNHALVALLFISMWTSAQQDPNVKNEENPNISVSEVPCPSLPVVEDYNLNRTLGRWYEIERVDNPANNPARECVTDDNILNTTDGTVHVFEHRRMNNGTYVTSEATLIPTKDADGRYIVTFPLYGLGVDQWNIALRYQVVMTDFDNYLVVYSCNTFPIPDAPVQLKTELGYIQSRTSTLPEDTIRMIKDYLEKFNVDSGKFVPTKQEGCDRPPIKAYHQFSPK